jgi:hypothetical protein
VSAKPGDVIVQELLGKALGGHRQSAVARCRSGLRRGRAALYLLALALWCAPEIVITVTSS